MKCEKAFDEYLVLDKNDPVPLAVTAHLLFCPECRSAIRQLGQAEKLLSSNFPEEQSVNVDDPFVAEIVERISRAGLAYPTEQVDIQRVSLSRWLVVGGVLAAGFALLPLSSIGSRSLLPLDSSFLLPFYLLSGGALTVYVGLFIGSNIDFFVKKFGFRHTV